MTTPTQPTAAYQGPAPAGADGERVRVALVASSGPLASDDLYRLLLRRLRLSFLIAAVALGVLFGHTLLAVGAASRSGEFRDAELQFQALNIIVLRGVPAIVSGVLALWLRFRPPASVRGLRVTELILVGVFVSVLVVGDLLNYGWWLRLPAGEDQIVHKMGSGLYVAGATLFWFCLITWYGALIPNTRGRATAVVGVLALTPVILFAVLAFRLRPSPSYIPVGFQLVFHTIFIGLAAAIAVFSSARIEVLRQQAAEARRLGQYVLREKLGGGGMGEVYRAEHVLLRRPCALKLIRPERAGDPDTLRRFEREVRITATLTHPNTIQVYDYGHAVDGTFYYVMEYLPGLTLEELVRRHGPLPPGRAVHFLRQVCAALVEAHGRGLTHRDIKPGNVMVCERGGVHDVVKLLDFGLVRPPKDDPDGGTLTREGFVAGTPAYMSPEQAGGQEGIDPRSDIYGVGALAYFLLAGKPPFADRSPVRMLAAHLYESPAPLPSDVPPDLAAVVLRCLAKSPSERWPSAAELESALAGVSAAAWTARDASAWWERGGRSDHEAGVAVATATRAEPPDGLRIASP